MDAVDTFSHKELAPVLTNPWGLKVRWYPVAVMMFCGVICFLSIDYSVSQQFGRVAMRGEFSNFLHAAEHFGTPYGQLLILIVAAAFAHWKDPRVIRIFVGTSVAGLSANGLKLLIARTRPNGFDFSDGTLLESFTDLMPFGFGGYTSQSFPSAHTASAFGFALMLSWAYPRVRPVFISLACLVGLQRICAGAHFPSDVCCGAAIGWLVASYYVFDSPVSRWWDRFEEILDKRFNQPRTDQD